MLAICLVAILGLVVIVEKTSSSLAVLGAFLAFRRVIRPWDREELESS